MRAQEHCAEPAMTRRLIRFPIADPLETALVAATELDREQLEQLRDQVAAYDLALGRRLTTWRLAAVSSR